MKKKFVIAFVLALVAILAFGGTALAWDYEDPLVADNEDFVYGGGNDMEEFHFGGQWLYGGGDGYNLYRDDVTDTGNLDSVWIHTETPDAIDLPSGLYYLGDESLDTWYWALEPRGYNEPEPEPVPEPEPTPIIVYYIKINLPDASERFQYCGKAVSAIDFNDGTWRIQIPAGTWILTPDGGMAFSLVVDSNGNIVSDVRFVYNRGGEVTVTRWGP